MANEKNISDVDKKLNNMSEEKKDEILQGFGNFKDYLKGKVEFGEKLGMSEETLAKGAEKVADYLANHEEPKNREEKLLQELWKVGNEEQRHSLAHLLVRMVEKE
ncbi:DUF3243 domain-containing protein [Pseudalkalibacillus caeni]|uniref:DUF3243 domain-containing protein n=1 Tax=Exobacillus caeni TaxID=2574798 RepID=A0A5R9F0U9_9BACL|nr:DUF3243 domain-containing protein [Pseudalkalibacillus caeni]TLS36056.1 DUF3243 domain-containing protein [Pseudalkalibacillus caeni]